MKGTDIEKHLEGTVHADTQRRARGFDVTVDEIAEIVEPGQLDFGGGELEPALARPLEPQRRDPDDDYGWWTLDAGTYLVSYNERLAEVRPGLVIQPRPALAEQGLSHPTLVVDDQLPRIPLVVPAAGAQIKQNARVSTLTAVEP